MFGSKQVNHEVIEMYKRKPHIETTVTFITPIERDSDLFYNLSFHPSSIAKVMEGLNGDIQEIIGDTFEADVEEVHCSVVDLYGSK